MLLSPAWPLRAYFRAYALLFTFLPCALMAVFIGYYLSARLQSRALEDMSRTLSLQKQFIDTWLGDRQRDVTRLAELPELADPSRERATEAFRRAVSVMPEVKGVVLTDESGRTVADTVATPGIDLSDRDYFKEGREGRPFISNVVTGRATGARIIIFSAPVNGPGGRFLGVVFATVSLDVIEKAVGGPTLEPGGHTLLLDGRGAIIRAEGQDAGAQNDPKPSEVDPGGSPFNYLAQDGSRMIALARRLDTTGWTLVGTVPEDSLSKAVRPALAVIFSAGLLSFLAIMPLAFRLARSIEKVVEPLASHAKGLAQGRYDQPPPALAQSEGPVELAVLAEAYETMRAKIIEDMRLLETMALTDELTGLPNRRSLMEEGPRLLELSARADKPCSCLMIDVDNFKSINDHYGHAKGDAVLAGVARALKGHSRASDLLGRLGGEEFLVVCANTGKGEARMLADRLLDGVRAHRQGGADRPEVTVSVGVSTIQAYAGDPSGMFDKLVQAADTCMYKAKSEGRNRVVSACCDPGAPVCEGPRK